MIEFMTTLVFDYNLLSEKYTDILLYGAGMNQVHTDVRVYTIYNEA